MRTWSRHPTSTSYFSHDLNTQKQTKKLGVVVDIGKPTSIENPSKDVGITNIIVPPALPSELKSVEQDVFRKICDVVGDDPVSESRLQFAPQWIIDKSIQKEKDNFTEKNAYKEVNKRSLPKNAILISSHHFFQVKIDGSSQQLKLKCRLVPHGNKDREKELIRKDSATAQFQVIRTLISASAILGFRLGTIDMSGAYLQVGRLKRDVYVRLPKGWTNNSFTVWKLLVPSYGLVESGRLCQLAVEECSSMVSEFNVQIVPGLVQLFVTRNKDGHISLLIVKVVDDFLIAGMPDDIKMFHDRISKWFKVGLFICDEDLVFNRLHMPQEPNRSVEISMSEYMSKIESLEIQHERRKSLNEKCTDEEMKEFLRLAGQLNWLGHGTLPQAAYISSLLQQWTAELRVRELTSQSNAVLAISDASQGKTSHGQTGYLLGLYFNESKQYHLLDWHSSKQDRLSFSSVGAEIIAAAERADRSTLMTASLQGLFGAENALPLVLTTDSHGIYSTTTALHEGKD